VITTRRNILAEGACFLPPEQRVLGAHQVSVGSQTADLSLLPNRRDVLSAVR
jgi:hypothetical protein